MKEIRLCSIDYTTKDGVTWKANILAHDLNEAVDFIRSRVGALDKIWSTSGGNKVDAVTKTVWDEIGKSEMVAKEKPKTDKDDNDYYLGDQDSSVLTCPFCQKEYKTAKTLHKHIMKFHGEM
jgi:hypothetical protein